MLESCSDKIFSFTFVPEFWQHLFFNSIGNPDVYLPRVYVRGVVNANAILTTFTAQSSNCAGACTQPRYVLSQTSIIHLLAEYVHLHRLLL